MITFHHIFSLWWLITCFELRYSNQQPWNNIEALLQSFETATLQVLMTFNNTKIEYMLLNEGPSQIEYRTVNGHP